MRIPQNVTLVTIIDRENNKALRTLLDNEKYGVVITGLRIAYSEAYGQAALYDPHARTLDLPVNESEFYTIIKIITDQIERVETGGTKPPVQMS